VTITSSIDDHGHPPLDRFQLGSNCIRPTYSNKLQPYAHYLIRLPVTITLRLYPLGQICRFVAEDSILSKRCLMGRQQRIGIGSRSSNIVDIVDRIAPTLEKGWHNQVTIKALVSRGSEHILQGGNFC